MVDKSQMWEYNGIRFERGGEANMINGALLSAKIRSMNKSVDQAAEECGIPKSSFYRKMSKKKHTFYIEEVRDFARTHRLTQKEVKDIFFTD